MRQFRISFFVPSFLSLLALPSLLAAQTITNPSFESPPEGSLFKQAYGGGSGTAPTLANSSYTFTGGGGIAGNGSAINSGGVVAPDGTQIAILQNFGPGAPGPFTSSFSQTITGFTVGTTYTLGFLDAARNSSQLGNAYNVTLTDASNATMTIFGGVSGFTPTAFSFTARTATFTATSSSETLAFNGLSPTNGDRTTFIDNLSLAATPEPASLGLLTTAGLVLLRRRTK